MTVRRCNGCGQDWTSGVGNLTVPFLKFNPCLCEACFKRFRGLIDGFFLPFQENEAPRPRCPACWGGPGGSQCKLHEGHDGRHSWQSEAEHEAERATAPVFECSNCGHEGPERSGPCPLCKLSSPTRREIDRCPCGEPSGPPCALRKGHEGAHLWRLGEPYVEPYPTAEHFTARPPSEDELMAELRGEPMATTTLENFAKWLAWSDRSNDIRSPGNFSENADRYWNERATPQWRGQWTYLAASLLGINHTTWRDRYPSIPKRKGPRA